MITPVQTIVLLFASAAITHAQDNLGIKNGSIPFRFGNLRGQIVRASQTLASLNSTSDFDFLPYDLLPSLTANGIHHIGDVTFRYRNAGAGGTWTSVDSATARKSVTATNSSIENVIAAADLTATLPSNLPLKITREWLHINENVESLAVRVNITNTAASDIEIGSLGLPISINNIFTGRIAEKTQQLCSLADPYIGLDGGYVRVSHLLGTGNALVITPLNATRFEAWRFLREPAGNFGYQSQTFEGNYEWQVHTLAYAENEWRGSQPWNTPSSKTLRPGETYSVGLRFSVAESLQKIEDTVVSTGTPLAVGIPGYVIPADSSARLYLNHTSAIESLESNGAFTITPPATPQGFYTLTPSPSTWGRALITVRYQDGKIQTVHYYITKSGPATLADLGHFFTTSAYFNDSSDPFRRSPSIMTYDRSTNSIVSQDSRVWIAGLSDEGGTGAYLATAMKQFAQPVASEVSKVDDFVHDTVVGTLQRGGSFGVVASSFFYEPGAVNFPYQTNFDWTSWTSWNRERAYTTRRAYNYIHPVATYWAMYRVARDHPDQPLRASWEWYLGRAFNTTQYCLANRAANCDYGLVGLMGEWVLGELLLDLKREKMSPQAAALETSMRYRAELWETQAVPFGSEMAWDSTGQEGVYFWTRYFNLTRTATKALNSVLAYTPTVAHWGWNGNARRYWDFWYGAKLSQLERQIHHYGSGLNSLPLLHAYEDSPEGNLYTLRVGFSANTAPLTNIDQEGFASAAFHSYPELLRWDAYSGDYGPGFLGLALGQGVYIAEDARYGDVVFGGDVVEGGGSASVVAVEPRDAVRRRAFVAALGLKIEISAGALQRVVYDKQSQSVELTVLDAVASTALKAKTAVVWLSRPGGDAIGYSVANAEMQRGGWSVDLSEGSVAVNIVKS
ncbi:hypothetical protein DM02DRAFT_720476 [Periconia macrospinosa]|uniref:Glycoside hydrolase family 43 protein n=1 Tax=Periconia macrospinosa TaxID=97972 RepID=A0A2V1DDL5_9PLEO|nr:hypothetical protein DM02DRAFT_720476 [Periconia macrospinosa]